MVDLTSGEVSLESLRDESHRSSQEKNGGGGLISHRGIFHPKFLKRDTKLCANHLKIISDPIFFQANLRPFFY